MQDFETCPKIYYDKTKIDLNDVLVLQYFAPVLYDVKWC